MKKSFVLGAIGGGFMAKAIIEGAVKSGFLSPREIVVSEPDGEKREYFSRLGIDAVADNRMVADVSDYLLLSVKPQNYSAVASEIKDANVSVIISIMAGKTKQSIGRALGGFDRIARVMPNLPSSIGMGASGVSAENLSSEAHRFVVGLFSSVGKVTEVTESQMNAVTGISGSGPAYVFLFLKALVSAGIAQGLSEDQARSLAVQTLKGGAEMADSSPCGFSDLIAAVSSKGGTTVAALEQFSRCGFEKCVRQSVAAAVRRAEELAE